MANADGAYKHVTYRVTARDRRLLVAEARRRKTTLSQLCKTCLVNRLLQRLRRKQANEGAAS